MMTFLLSLGLVLALSALILAAAYAGDLRERLVKAEVALIHETARADRAEDRYAQRRFSVAPSVSTGQGWREDVLLRDWMEG